MPTYDYRCDRCGHAFDAYQSITAAPLRKCPACASNGLQRLIGTGGGVIFKGSGFYQTDYRSDSYKQAAKKEQGAADAKSDAGAKSDGGDTAQKSTKPDAGAKTGQRSKDGTGKTSAA